jgi:hypothetical protein
MDFDRRSGRISWSKKPVIASAPRPGRCAHAARRARRAAHGSSGAAYKRHSNRCAASGPRCARCCCGQTRMFIVLYMYLYH